MNKLSKEQWLAEKVMVWELDNTTFPDNPMYIINESKESTSTIFCRSWEPKDNIEQAHMIACNFEHNIIYDLESFEVEIWNNDNDRTVTLNVLLPKAITEAVLKASGYYNE